ncbi:hypothetical protein [Acinetobacter pittii]|nr:hypothetical protein [Acinetobacter pittii]AZB96383.1 hypothetical protein DKE42_005600 [Acinetobacter pittii]MDR9713580.1 hypothetical protein [Acinetobacter pittii]MEB3857934.1 hypothetical protein [Acinetobacter pittii]
MDKCREEFEAYIVTRYPKRSKEVVTRRLEEIDGYQFYTFKEIEDAWVIWQHQQAKVEELQRRNQMLNDNIKEQGQKLVYQNEVIETQAEKLLGLRDEKAELQKRVEGLERKLQIKTRHCEFYEQSRKGHRSLAIHRKKQINSALEQIEKLYSRAESDYQKDRNPYYDGMLSALDLAEQAIRGELEEQALKGEGQ